MHRVRMRLEKVKMALDTSLFDRLDEEDVVLNARQASACRGSAPSSYSSPPPTSPTSIKPTVSGPLMMPLACIATYAACPFCDRAFAETEASTQSHSSSLFDDDFSTSAHGGESSAGAAQVASMLPDYVYMVL